MSEHLSILKNLVKSISEKALPYFKENIFKIVSLSAIWILLFVFRNFISIKIDTLLFESKFYQIEYRWLEKLLITIPFIIIIIWIIIKWKEHYIFSFKKFLAYTYFLFIYFIFRFFQNEFDFVTFHNGISFIKLTDTFFVLWAILLFIHVKSLLRKTQKIDNQSPKKSYSGFRIEKPLEPNDEEHLGYTVYSQRLVAKIKETQYLQKSFAIGINGAWGIGKSSFLNLVKNGLGDDEYIHIHFRPWEAENSSQIIVHFVQELKNTLKVHHADLDNLLDDYLFNFIDNQDQWYFKVIRTFRRSKTVEDTKNAIEQAIKKINKKLVIYIDDVDRLQGEEVVEVLKLIRGNANFSNTFYLVAYDRLFVEEAISKNIVNYNSSQFLEKIFNVEITLPFFTPQMLMIYFTKVIESIKVKEGKSDIVKALNTLNGEYKTWPISSIFVDVLKTPRDINRVINALYVNLKIEILEEIDINKLFILEILRLKFPKIYNTLKYNRSSLLKIEDGLYTIIDEEINSTIIGKEKELTHKNFEDLISMFEIDKNHCSAISMILKKLFSPFEKPNFDFNDIRYYDRYFMYRIDSNKLSDSEFEQILNSSFQPKLLKSCIDEGKFNSLLENICNINLVNSKNFHDVLLLIEIIFRSNYINNKTFIIKGIASLFNNYLSNCEIGVSKNHPMINKLRFNQ